MAAARGSALLGSGGRAELETGPAVAIGAHLSLDCGTLNRSYVVSLGCSKLAMCPMRRSGVADDMLAILKAVVSRSHKKQEDLAAMILI